MPPYVPTGPVKLLEAGQNAYLFGSNPTNRPTARFTVQQTSGDGTHATLNVTLVEGFAPLVGDLASVTGTTRAAGAFNVTGVALTAVSLDPVTGIGTISFLSAASAGAAADPGNALVPVSEIGETLAAGTSRAVAVQLLAGDNENTKTITWSTQFPGAVPSAVTVTLQASMVNVDADYSTLDTSTNTAGEIRQLAGSNLRFLRAVISGVTGGSKVIVRVGV